MDEILFFLPSILSSLLVALLAVKFDRWLAEKNELNSILSGIGFEIAENISVARTIAKQAEDGIKTLQSTKHPFAPFPTFSDWAYFQAKNSNAFLNFVVKEKTGLARELVKNLHECYHAIRLVNHMMETIQQVKVEIMLHGRPREYGEQVFATTKKTIEEAIEPQLIKALLLLEQVEPKLHRIVSLFSKISTNQNAKAVK